MARERTSSGEFRSSVTDGDILAFIREADRPFQSSRDVADHFGMERSSAFRRLKQLAVDDRVCSGKAGAARVWWLSDTDEERPAADRDRDRDYLKSFGKYAGTNIAETAEAVGERFDRDLRERRTQRTDGGEGEDADR